MNRRDTAFFQEFTDQILGDELLKLYLYLNEILELWKKIQNETINKNEEDIFIIKYYAVTTELKPFLHAVYPQGSVLETINELFPDAPLNNDYVEEATLTREVLERIKFPIGEDLLLFEFERNNVSHLFLSGYSRINIGDYSFTLSKKRKGQDLLELRSKFESMRIEYITRRNFLVKIFENIDKDVQILVSLIERNLRRHGLVY